MRLSDDDSSSTGQQLHRSVLALRQNTRGETLEHQADEERSDDTLKPYTLHICLSSWDGA